MPNSAASFCSSHSWFWAQGRQFCGWSESSSSRTVRRACIARALFEDPEVLGAYDLIMYNYGPNKNYASVHIELPDTMTVDEADKLSRKIQVNVYQKSGVILTGVGVYSRNTSNSEAAQMRNAVLEKVLAYDWALQLHAFYADMENKTIRFDVVVSFDIDKNEALDILTKDINAMYPDYTPQIVTDIDA